jgi:hypothetical protein
MSHIHDGRMYNRQHANVVALIGAVTTHLRRGLMGDIHFYIYLGKLYMVMEYCNQGSLENYLQEQCGTRASVDSVGIFVLYLFIHSQVQAIVDVSELLSFAYQIANGMVFLNSRTVSFINYCFENSFCYLLGDSP